MAKNPPLPASGRQFWDFLLGQAIRSLTITSDNQKVDATQQRYQEPELGL
jgi:hypothetical protein